MHQSSKPFCCIEYVLWVNISFYVCMCQSVAVWQCITVYYGVTWPAHSTCVLSEYSSASKLHVIQSFYVQALVCA